MKPDVVSTELYTRAAESPPHSELAASDPSREKGEQAIFANLIRPGSGVLPYTSEQARAIQHRPVEVDLPAVVRSQEERQQLYSKARCSGVTSSADYEKVVGRKLTSDEERALWDNKGDEDLVAMGR